MNIRHALIMAAGRGQRMMPLTEYIPKPMISINGISLIGQGIEKLKTFIPNIHITVGYKGAMLASHVIEHKVSTVVNSDGKTNSWWIYNSIMKYIDEPILVLTCDNVIELNYRFLEKDYFDSGSPVCMIVPVKPIEGLEGDYIFQNERIVSEINRNKVSPIYCSGIQILNPFLVNKYSSFNEKYSFYDLWGQLIIKKQLLCSNIYPEKWISIDNLEQLDKVKHF
ncbi:MAG: nucleotidyltransferase family protein [Ignavibacteriaceae bacterium]